MPRGLKECPNCRKSVGLRTQKCECGHSFYPTKLADTTATAGGIVAGSTPPPDPDPPAAEERQPALRGSEGREVVHVPAGKPPCKPEGHPWEGSKASDDQIVRWAEQVRAAGWTKDTEYSAEAVCYFARYFWDINGPEYRRVREVVIKALC